VLFRDPAVGRFYKHDSPYTYFSSDDLHLGEISLECSRPGAAAAALWATMRLLPLAQGGTFARALERGLAAALDLRERLADDARFVVPDAAPELDIVVWAVAAPDAAAASARARTIFAESARRDLHLALATLPARMLPGFGDEGAVTCLRSVLMKPDHADWIDAIWERLDAACA
jgi:glutamate/tyrosine decarboxylase-like PLP-dependent enzyme